MYITKKFYQVGKSQIAYAFANLYRTRFNYGFYINAAADNVYKDSIKKITDLLKINDGFTKWLENPSNMGWLLV